MTQYDWFLLDKLNDGLKYCYVFPVIRGNVANDSNSNKQRKLEQNTEGLMTQYDWSLLDK